MLEEAFLVGLGISEVLRVWQVCSKSATSLWLVRRAGEADVATKSQSCLAGRRSLQRVVRLLLAALGGVYPLAVGFLAAARIAAAFLPAAFLFAAAPPLLPDGRLFGVTVKLGPPCAFGRVFCLAMILPRLGLFGHDAFALSPDSAH